MNIDLVQPSEGLTRKYDQFYDTDLQPEPFDDLKPEDWPRNRSEAICFVQGSGAVILDIGCGNGYLLYQFRNRFRKLVGLEFSRMRLAQARVNLAGLNFDGLYGTAEAIPLETETIDRIISADTVEHIPDVYVATDEMFRVLKHGGQLVVNTPNIAFLKKRLLLLLGRFPSTSQSNEGLGSDILFDGGHLHYFTFRSLRLLLERSGFRDITAIGFGRFGKAHDCFPSLLSGGVQLVAIKP